MYVSGSSSHTNTLPRFLSDLKPHYVQSQPATPAVLSSRNPRQPGKSELQRSISQAATSLRPRYGKEYLRINRRRLASSSAIDWSPGLSTPRSPGSQSLATLCVFDFDTLTCAQGNSQYSNNTQQANCIDLDTVLIPQQPVSAVNYTDLDLVSNDSNKSKQAHQQPSTLYADIDFKATAAVSLANREHVINRRDNRLSAASRTNAHRNLRPPPLPPAELPS